MECILRACRGPLGADRFALLRQTTRLDVSVGGKGIDYKVSP